MMFIFLFYSSYNIVKTKFCNTWGVAASVAHITYSIIWNTKECITVSTHINVNIKMVYYFFNNTHPFAMLIIRKIYIHKTYYFH